MSKKNKEAMAEATQSKNVGYRLFAVLLIAICALAIVVIPYHAIYNAAAANVSSNTLLTIIQDLFKGDSSVLGAIPSFAVSGTVGTVYTLSTYLFVAGIVVAAILALVAIFNGKKAPMLVRTAIFYLTCGAVLYTLSFTLALETYTANGMFGATYEDGSILSKLPVMVDLCSLALALGGAVLYFLFAVAKVGKIAWLHLLQAILTAAFVVLLAHPIAKSDALVNENAESFAKIAMLVGVIALYANTMIAIGRMTRKGGMIADLVRFIIVLLINLLVVFKANSAIYGILAAAVVVLQIIIVIVQIVKSNKQKVEEAQQEATEAAISGFHTEEYAEAYPYEGGPVSGVLMAEEVNPSFLPHEPHVTTAGYDFYNCKSFDPFIATLDTAERNEFTELFILKFKGTMPELPDYEVGGDNKEFFRKLFIYLGQYRDRMSQTLLMKMYQYSMKI